MHVRRVTLLVSLSLATVMVAVTVVGPRSRLLAQQPGASPGSASAVVLPEQVQANLDRLRAELRVIQAAGDAKTQATTLNALGRFYSNVSEYQESLDTYNQALAQARIAKDALQEAAALSGIGDGYRNQIQNDKAVDTYQQALDLTTASGDLVGQATALNGLGWVSANAGQNAKALEDHNKALPLAQQAGDRYLEGTILRRIGIVHSALGEKQQALDFYNRALPIEKAMADRDGEASTDNDIGLVHFALGEKQNALDSYNEALPIFQAVGDRGGEAMTLRNIGDTYDALGQKQMALESYDRAQRIYQSGGDRNGEANTLMNMGYVSFELGDKQMELNSYSQALVIYRAMSDAGHEAAALLNVGIAYAGLGDTEQALDSYKQALPLFERVHDSVNQATTLLNLGIAYAALGDSEDASKSYNQAIPIFHAMNDPASEANALTSVGNIYLTEGKEQEALNSFSQALAISQKTGNPSASLDLGYVYAGLGDKKKALDYFNQSLSLFKAKGDKTGQSNAEVALAGLYIGQGKNLKALAEAFQAESIEEKLGDPDGEAKGLVSKGLICSAAGMQSWALKYYNQALPLFRSVADQGNEAVTLLDLGAEYSMRGNNRKALEYYNQALPIAVAAGPLLQAKVLYSLMRAQRRDRPTLAIFYGKQAVNLLQQVRGEIQGLDRELQKSFVVSNDDYYRGLAEVLIDQRRLPEAIHVLNLLKEQEYAEYTRSDITNVLGALTMTPAELQAEEDYQDSTTQILKVAQLLEKTPAGTARDALLDQMERANEGFDGYTNRLYVLLGKDSTANEQVADVTGAVDTLKLSLVNAPNVVALYTLLTKDGYRVIVVTGSTQVAREIAISEDKMDLKLEALWEALYIDQSDAKQAAQDLYNTVMKPVEDDLKQANAKTLVWSLDGLLRYVPMGALYDGKQYMVEKYRMVTVTPSSLTWLHDTPDMGHLSAVGMGISRAYKSEPLLPELKGVAAELKSVINDKNLEGANGVLPGRILLNEEFTEKAMENQLATKHSVVHIASHFVFEPEDSESFLLLADGAEKDKPFHLTVADFRIKDGLKLAGVELLTLSACKTGLDSKASNGRDVDGLGTTAQKKGAKAVISTLWDAADNSTAMLMPDFYGRWAKGGGKVEKAEALQQAQLDLLLGKDRKGGSQFANPYYWAPFVLMGNWK